MSITDDELERKEERAEERLERLIEYCDLETEEERIVFIEKEFNIE